MATRSILIHPDPRLRKVAEPVGAFDDGLQTLIDDMFETMYAAPGIGLAAPQVGVSRQVMVMDCALRDAEEAALLDAAQVAVAETPPPPRAPEPPQPDPPPAQPNPLALINPEITWASEETRRYNEGCLSIPEQFDDVTRPAEVKVRYQDRDGAAHEAHFTGLAATCVQHEIDHLQGKLFIDYLGPVRRSMITSKMKKLKRERAKEKARGEDKRS